MGLRKQTLEVTLDGSGAGAVTSQRPLNGYVDSIRGVNGGTATFTFTQGAGEGGGTVSSLSGQVGPFWVYPRALASGGGGSAVCQIPVDGQLTMTVASGVASKAMTVHVYYDEGH